MPSPFAQNLIQASFEDTYKPVHQNGPDYVSPATEIRTWLPDGKVRLNGSRNPTTLVTFFRQSVEKYPSKIALVVKRSSINVKWTYAQYWSDVQLVAKGFIKLGLQPFNGVCMLGFNSPEWLLSFFGAVFAGGLPAGIYTTNTPAACFHVLNDCNANIVVVEDELQLKKILQIRDKLPHLKAIIQYIGKPTHPDVLSWSELLEIGRSVSDSVLDKRVKDLSVNQCCCLIYTSGTTGNPKGVMLSHDNIISCNQAMSNFWTIDRKKTIKFLSYLPLSHLAAVMSDIFLCIDATATLYFATPDALKGKMVDILREVQPTTFLAVPRVLEKIFEKLQDAEMNMKPFKKTLFRWAQRQGVYHHLNGNSNNTKYKLARKLVFSKLKTLMGLQNLTHVYTGGAPVDRDLKKFFLGLDLVVLDLYGLSESTGIIVGNTKDDFQLDGLGRINFLKDYEVKISNSSNDGTGEIVTRGRHVCMGYLKLEKETKEIIDEEHWLYTGDLGIIDANDTLHLTGRLKELLITAGGENIPPVLIESCVKKHLPVISNCMLIGDKRKYLTMLITLKTEFDLEKLLPTDELTSLAILWCRSVGSQANTVSEILQNKDENVMRAIQDGITKYNNNDAISNAQKIQKWTILPQDFSIPNGDFGPTGKMRRPIILEKNEAIIAKMYAN